MNITGIEKEGMPDHKWQFNGQEKEESFNLLWLDYKYRKNYDLQLARFHSVDPITEEYVYLTPYQHASNNPIWFIELEGLEGVPFQHIDHHRLIVARGVYPPSWSYVKVKGRSLENAFVRAINGAHNYKVLPSTPKNYAPDLSYPSYRTDFGLSYVPPFLTWATKIWTNGVHFEVKATKGNIIGEDGNEKELRARNQLLSSINYIGSTLDLSGDESAAAAEVGYLFIVSYAGKKVDDDIISAAEDAGVKLYLIETNWDKETQKLYFQQPKKLTTDGYELFDLDNLEENAHEGIYIRGLYNRWKEQGISIDWGDAKRNAGLSNE